MNPESFHELTGWLRLSLTPGVGDLSARRLLTAFGLPQHIFEQPLATLRQVVSAAQAQALKDVPPEWHQVCDRVHEWLSVGPHHQLITLADTTYPRELLETADPPLLLYLLGDVRLLAHPRKVAVVGSRNPTPQGVLNARDMSGALAGAGVCVVSGLALGVDGAAHEGALDVGGATIAVVGTGLDRVYPSRHRALAHRIAASGLVVSEFGLGTSPAASNFPKRNRIIAGLSQGTLVVEAALASGSLITARLAADMGREVFAIPGSIHATQAKGCHALIRQGAKLVESAQDVLEDLRFSIVLSGQGPQANDPFSDDPSEASTLSPSDASRAIAMHESPAAQGLLDALGFDIQGLDQLQARTGLPTASLQALLLELELDGHVARMPGGQFQRLMST